MTPNQIIQHLNLAPHPEGGHYRQTWVADNDGRPVGTCIYFLLREGERSRWHTVDATEIWHWYAGSPLILSRSPSADGPATDDLLGPDLLAGQFPQLTVETGHYQAAHAAHGWALVGCTVSPGFQFEGFHLESPDFDIPR